MIAIKISPLMRWATLLTVVTACSREEISQFEALQPQLKQASFDPNHTLVTTNPNLLDPLAGGGDPNVTGINPGQYPSCNYGSPSLYQVTTSCPTIVGSQTETEGFCHVPQGFAERRNSDPPTGGNHYPIPEATLGEHTTPVLRGNYIHSMEHGAIIFTYNCPNNCDSELSVLRQAIAARSGHLVIMTPDPLMTSSNRFAALSWSWIYSFDQPDVNQLTCFIDQHELYGRECTNRVCVALTSTVMVVGN